MAPEVIYKNVNYLVIRQSAESFRWICVMWFDGITVINRNLECPVPPPWLLLEADFRASPQNWRVLKVPSQSTSHV